MRRAALRSRCQARGLHILLEPRIAATLVRCSPDGRLLVARRGMGTVGVWSLADGRHLRDLPISGNWPREIRFTAAGNMLVIAGWQEVTVYDMPEGTLRHRWPAAYRRMLLLDGERMVGLAGRELRCHRLNDGHVLWAHRLPCQHGLLLGVVDGRVMVGRHHDVIGIPVDDPGAARRLHRRRGASWLAARAEGEQPVFFGDFDQDGCGLSNSARPAPPLRLPERQQDVAFTPDGERFAVCSWRRRQVYLRRCHVDEEPTVIRTSARPVGLSFTPDGRRLVVGMRERIGIFELGPTAEPPLSIRSDGSGDDATVSIDEIDGPGRISGHADGTLRFWYPGLSRSCFRVDFGEGAVEALGWEDGDLMVRMSGGVAYRLRGGSW